MLMISVTNKIPPCTLLQWPLLHPHSCLWAGWKQPLITRWGKPSLNVSWYLYQCLIRNSCSRILIQTWPNIRTREIEADRKSLLSILRDFLWRRLFTKVGCYHEQNSLLITNVLMSGYACAIIGDILLQGHLYVTDNYLGFHSNVFGYVTRVCISSSIQW